MNYSKYKESRDMTWEELKKNNISALPVKISDICKNRGIKVVSYKNGMDFIKSINALDRVISNDGFSVGNIIFFNSAQSVERQRFTVAHELGHIVLGHTLNGQLVNREISPNDNPIETAANVFASRILAPACVLWGIGVTDYKQIQELCNISSTAAKFRMERLQTLYDREREFLKTRGKSCFLLSPLERKVYKQFEDFIKEVSN